MLLQIKQKIPDIYCLTIMSAPKSVKRRVYLFPGFVSRGQSLLKKNEAEMFLLSDGEEKANQCC